MDYKDMDLDMLIKKDGSAFRGNRGRGRGGRGGASNARGGNSARNVARIKNQSGIRKRDRAQTQGKRAQGAG